MTLPAIFSLAFFTLCMIAGEWWPRRSNDLPWYRRWLTNLSLHGLVLATGRVLAAGTVFGFAVVTDGARAGLLPLLHAPPVLAFVITFLAFDLFRFAEHRILHMVPWLWRLHAVHHSDIEFDTTTHYRHHPLESVVSMTFHLGFVGLLGPDPFALLCAGTAHHYNSLFNHSNIALPPALDRILRWLIVTPDVHRIHHSIQRKETDSNFGNLLSCWDRLFGCYVEEPEHGQTGFVLGLEEYREPHKLSLWGQLKGPFMGISKPPRGNRLVESTTFPSDGS